MSVLDIDKRERDRERERESERDRESERARERKIQEMSDTRSQIKTMKVSAKTDEMVGRGVGKTAHTQVHSK